MRDSDSDFVIEVREYRRLKSGLIFEPRRPRPDPLPDSFYEYRLAHLGPDYAADIFDPRKGRTMTVTAEVLDGYLLHELGWERVR
jgi:hypothetical protein